MGKMAKIFSVLLLISLLALSSFAVEYYVPPRATATGTAMIQSYSGLNSQATLTFYATSENFPESQYSSAWLVIDSDKNWPGISLKGKFSGGPDGTITFITPENSRLEAKLTGGRAVYLKIPGAVIDLRITDPSVFDPEEIEISDEDLSKTGPDSGVKISDRDGQIEIACPPDLEAWDVLKPGRTIYINCHVKTGEDSSVVLSFPDMTTLKMKPETELIITNPPEQTKISLLTGKIWANIKKMAKDGTMEIHSSQAVAGIKGTTLVIEDNGFNTTLKVIEGSVSFRSLGDGKETLVNQGEYATAGIKGFSQKGNFDTGSESSSWEKGKFPILPAIVVLLLSLLGAGAFLFLKGKKGKGRERQ